MQTDIDEETVAELRDAVRDLLRDEDAHSQTLTGRATALAGFVGVILSIAAAAGPVGDAGGTGVDRRVALAADVAVALALLVLVGAVLVVVARVLLPSQGVRIATAEIDRYPTFAFVSQPRVMIQGRLLRLYVEALARERDRNEEKARWLRVAYIATALGVGLVAAAAAAVTIDRHI